MANWNGKVSASSDDARNINGGTSKNVTAQTMHLGKFNTTDDYWNGFRWTNVTIPAGATITSATVDLYSAQVTAGTTAKTIWYGVLEANTATYNTSTEYPEGKARTTASVNKDFTVSTWNATLGYGAELVDVTTLIQEIIDQGGWSSGNALSLVAHNNGSSNTNYVGHSTYDRDVTRGAYLDITYTTGGGSQTVSLSFTSSAEVLYAPTITPGAVAVLPPSISSSTSLYSPSITVGSVAIQPPLISSATTVNTPIVSTGQVSLDLPSISSSSAAYAPSVSVGAVDLTPPLLSSTTTLYAPTLAHVVLLPTVATAEALYAPSLSVGAVSLTLPSIASEELINPPIVDTGQVNLLTPSFTNSTTLYGPTVLRGAVSIALPYTTNSSTLYAPSIGVGAVTLEPSLVFSSLEVYAPIVDTGEITIQLPLISSSTLIYDQTIVGDQIITLAFISSISELYLPSVGVPTLRALQYTNVSIQRSTTDNIITRGADSLDIVRGDDSQTITHSSTEVEVITP